MNFTFRGKRISGMLIVVPENERTFIEEMKNYNFPEARSLKLKEVMVTTGGVSSNPASVSPIMAVFGLRRLFDRNC